MLNRRAFLKSLLAPAAAASIPVAGIFTGQQVTVPFYYVGKRMEWDVAYKWYGELIVDNPRHMCTIRDIGEGKPC